MWFKNEDKCTKTWGTKRFIILIFYQDKTVVMRLLIKDADKNKVRISHIIFMCG